MSEQSVAIIGSGGIGGFLAGELAGAGRDPVLCVRTPIPSLTIEEKGVAREVPVRIATDPADVAPARWILLTTKGQDTAGAGPWLQRLAVPGTTIVVVQNGIEHEERVRPVAGTAAVMPSIIYCSVERVSPGRIVYHGLSRLIVPAGPDAPALADLFAGTRFEIVIEPDFRTAAWRKLLSNLAANPITALTLRRTRVFREEDSVLALAADLLAEAVRVAAADGAALTAADAETIAAGFANLTAGGGSSMLYDRLTGRPLEHEHITGAVVRAAERHGIEVPLNRAILALLRAASGRPLDGSA